MQTTVEGVTTALALLEMIGDVPRKKRFLDDLSKAKIDADAVISQAAKHQAEIAAGRENLASAIKAHEQAKAAHEQDKAELQKEMAAREEALARQAEHLEEIRRISRRRAMTPCRPRHAPPIRVRWALPHMKTWW